MINLLPADLKRSYRYGIANVSLVKWVATGVIAILGLGVIGTYGWLSLHQDIVHYDKQIAVTKSTLKREKQKETYAQVQDITNSFSLVVKVLKNEVLFSKLLRDIAQVLPTRTYLSDLSLTKDDGALNLSVRTYTQYDATQVQINLSDPKNPVFQRADINSINCSNPTDGGPPCTVNIRALLGSNNQYLFINQKGIR